MLNMPLVQIDSIGAGTGSFVRINPNSNRPELGPDSAGARIGVCWPEGGLETVSITDLNLVLGRVNPDYFLGGDIQLDPERAHAEVERQVAEPLGLDVARRRRRRDRAVRADAAKRGGRAHPRQGVLARRLRPALLRRRRTAARRRLHRGRRLPRRPGPRVGGRLLRLRLRLRRLRVPLRPDDRHADPADRRRDGEGGDRDAWSPAPGWDSRSGSRTSSRSPGIERDRITFTHAARMQYYGQLNDIEIVSPHMEMEEGEHVDDADRRLRGGVREGLRPLGPLTGARLPDHPGDRPRLGRGREAGAARELEEVSGQPPVTSTRTVRWRDGDAETSIIRLEDVVRRPRDRGPGDRRALGNDVRDPARAARRGSTPTASST